MDPMTLDVAEKLSPPPFKAKSRPRPLNMTVVACKTGSKEPPQSFLEQYEVGPVLGYGSFATVSVATKISDRTRLAMKHVNSSDEEMIQSAWTEFNLMKSFSHQAILRVYEMHGQRLGTWMFMELCADGSVDSFIHKRGVFSDEQARRHAYQMYNGIWYLHMKRVVHRDIKPANLMLTDSGMTLKIGDFNSAKRVGREGKSAMLTDRGTHIYSAPELYFGEVWNERVDVWAAGLCTYYFYHGKLPFIITDPSHSVVLRSGDLPEFPWGFIPELIQNLILQCLVVNGNERPPMIEVLVHQAFEEHCTSSRCLSSETFYSDTESSPTPSPSSSKGRIERWQERRDGTDSWKMLAFHRYQRTDRRKSTGNKLKLEFRYASTTG